MSSQTMVPLHRGHEVEKDLYDMVLQQARETVPRLRFGKEYKTKDLVDPELWDCTDARGHRLIGRCIAHMVSHRLLALAFVGCPRCSNKRYLRI
jgi:hypothetical protein